MKASSENDIYIQSQFPVVMFSFFSLPILSLWRKGLSYISSHLEINVPLKIFLTTKDSRALPHKKAPRDRAGGEAHVPYMGGLTRPGVRSEVRKGFLP